MKTQVNIDEKTKRKIIDLRNQHKKKIREIVEIIGKSSRDVTAVLKEYEIQQAQPTKDEKKHEVDKGAQNSHGDLLLNVKAYKLFDEGKSPLEVTTELNLPGPQVQQFYVEYMDLRKMHKVVTIYQENKSSIGYFLELFRLGKKKGVTPEQIMKLIQMADGIHKLQEKLQQLQIEVLDVGAALTFIIVAVGIKLLTNTAITIKFLFILVYRTLSNIKKVLNQLAIPTL